MGIGNLPPIGFEPVAQQENPTAGDGDTLPELVALCLIHDEDEIGAEGKGGVHLAPPMVLKRSPDRGRQPPNLGGGGNVDQGPETCAQDLHLCWKGLAQKHLSQRAPAVVALA